MHLKQLKERTDELQVLVLYLSEILLSSLFFCLYEVENKS